MAKNFQFTIASVTDVVFQGSIESVTLPGVDGEMTILAHHAPLVTTLAAGDITVRQGNEEPKVFPVAGGILDVGNNNATVLV